MYFLLQIHLEYIEIKLKNKILNIPAPSAKPLPGCLHIQVRHVQKRLLSLSPNTNYSQTQFEKSNWKARFQRTQETFMRYGIFRRYSASLGGVFQIWQQRPLITPNDKSMENLHVLTQKHCGITYKRWG